MLDFGFQGTARNFAGQNGSTDNVAGFYAADDYYTDADSNAYSLPLFLGNHDIGRIGLFMQQDNPGASDAELVARSELAHALMYFGRGMPVVYYGDEQGFTGDGGDQDARQDMMPSLVASYNDDDLIGTTATTADANFDVTHPLYETLADYGALLDAHPALTQGAQLHRYSEGSAGIYAFSRIERTEQVEYVVALNNSESADSATFDTDSPSTGFTEIWPGTGPAIASDAAGNLTVDVPALGVQGVPRRRRHRRARRGAGRHDDARLRPAPRCSVASRSARRSRRRPTPRSRSPSRSTARRTSPSAPTTTRRTACSTTCPSYPPARRSSSRRSPTTCPARSPRPRSARSSAPRSRRASPASTTRSSTTTGPPATTATTRPATSTTSGVCTCGATRSPPPR